MHMIQTQVKHPHTKHAGHAPADLIKFTTILFFAVVLGMMKRRRFDAYAAGTGDIVQDQERVREINHT